MKITKAIKNKIINNIDIIAREHEPTEYGLPVFDEGQMSLMREAIDEALKNE